MTEEHFTGLDEQNIHVIVAGEFMQLGSKEHPDERFNHYLEKTYKKTASLIACCCKAVSLEILVYSGRNCEFKMFILNRSYQNIVYLYTDSWFQMENALTM